MCITLPKFGLSYWPGRMKTLKIEEALQSNQAIEIGWIIYKGK